ncbi:MAG: 16S rRNA (guanine(527)-N(7))-methyltransferase RsmG [Candidatus Marinarcus sp.]|uniref:16S rRNA (guanine(527)-N(7))-methyltransferase RsmG n=1 Tax=Candidatus Marinarcus sp. TaxID=3100987 RepID=UPI003B00EEBA
MNTNKFEALNLNFDALFYERCEKYIALLQQWGRVHNFTAELQTYQIEDNMVDSLYPLKFLETFNSFADIGTGAGYPGMILALARPDTKAVLIEPRNKRVAFLNFVKSALKLENLQVIGKRVEEVQNEEPFDLITSRAVTNTSLLLELTQNIAHEKTHYLFYKGSLLNDELEKAKIHAYTIVNVDERNYLYIKNKGVV